MSNDPTHRVLISWELGGGMGHLMPLRSIIRDLVKSGVRTYLLTRDIDLSRRLFARLECEIVECPTLPQSCILPTRASVFADVLTANGFAQKDELAIRFRKWCDTIIGLRPDFVLCDHSPSALMVSRNFGLPAAPIGTGFCCPPDQDILPNWRPWLNESASELVFREHKVVEAINEVMLPGTGIDRIGQLYSECATNFLMSYVELDHFPDREFGTYRGTVSNEEGKPPVWPCNKGRKVFAYLKNTPGLEAILACLDGAGFSSIVCISRLSADEANGLNRRFRNVDICSDSISLPHALSECDFAVHHGTHGVASSTLLAGKPAAVFPIALEQRITGVRIYQLRAGQMGNPCSHESVCATISAVASDQALVIGAQAFAAKYSNFNRDQVSTRIAAEICGFLS